MIPISNILFFYRWFATRGALHESQFRIIFISLISGFCSGMKSAAIWTSSLHLWSASAGSRVASLSPFVFCVCLFLCVCFYFLSLCFSRPDCFHLTLCSVMCFTSCFCFLGLIHVFCVKLNFQCKIKTLLSNKRLWNQSRQIKDDTGTYLMRQQQLFI